MKQKEIVLVPFPYSDQYNKKVRPGLVISNNLFNNNSDDVVLCAVTSNLHNSDFCVEINAEDMDSGVLYTKSLVKAESIFKIEKSLVIKSIGAINKTKFSEVLCMVKKLIEPSE